MTSCKQLDLLPICCSFCNQKFCKSHFQPFQHSCSSQQLGKEITKSPHDTHSEMHICSLSTCNTNELISMPCPHCSLHFCLQHRHQVDHQCEKLEKKQDHMPQTASLIKQIQDKNLGKKFSQGVKSDKLAAKVQLMKLKQNSKGVNELPAEERVYFSVQKPLCEAKESVFVSKFWSIGKSIDFISSSLKIPNSNNLAGKPQLNLFDSAGHCFSEKKDTLIKELLECERIFNGQTIVLKYVEQ